MSGLNEFSLRVDRLGKAYRSLDGNQFTALSDVSFSLQKGDVLGVVGNNGSGKSTLLSIISGITRPSSGSVFLNGSCRSILDAGSNFVPDLTGVENVRMSLSMAAFAPERIEFLLDEIQQFSEIGGYYHKPIKFYSTGMFVRLAFALTYHMDADIVVLDEVLSAGDVGFRKKSLNLFRELTSRGKTVVIVSHDIPEIVSCCNRCLWLCEGKVMAFGEANEVCSRYFYQSSGNNLPVGFKNIDFQDNWNDSPDVQFSRRTNEVNLDFGTKGPSDGKVRLLSLSVTSSESGFNTDQSIFVKLSYIKESSLNSIVPLITIYDHLKQPIAMFSSLNNVNKSTISAPSFKESETFYAECEIPPRLFSSGECYISVHIGCDVGVSKYAPFESLVYHIQEPIYIGEGIVPNYIGGDMSNVRIRPAVKWNIHSQNTQ